MPARFQAPSGVLRFTAAAGRGSLLLSPLAVSWKEHKMWGPKDRMVLTSMHLKSSHHHDNVYSGRFYWPHFINIRNRDSEVTKQYFLYLSGQETFFFFFFFGMENFYSSFKLVHLFKKHLWSAKCSKILLRFGVQRWIEKERVILEELCLVEELWSPRQD